MELIEYGQMRCDVIRTLSCERTRVTDAANNYLHTHWDLTVEVNWHPALVAYTRVAAPIGGNPVYARGTLPGQTDLSLLSILLQPRQLLRITAGRSVILETPFTIQDGSPKRYPCDVKGGPSVEAVGVPQMIGFRHWVVTLHIIADVRDIASGLPSDRSAVISNLWVSNEDIDEQRRSVRRFAGRAILRADVMRQYHDNANAFRDLMLFRCPPHYQRMNVSVQISEDGTVCDWSFEDKLVGYDLGAGSEILKIECFRSGRTTRNSPLKLMTELVRGTFRGFQGGALAAVGAVPLGLALAALDNLPTSYLSCRCDLRGDRNANLGRLTSIAYGICQTQMGTDSGQFFTGGLEVNYRQDIADEVFTSVEMSSQFTSDAVITAIKDLGVNFLGVARRIATGVPVLDAVSDLATVLALSIDAGAAATKQHFMTDSRQLTLVGGAAAPAAAPAAAVNGNPAANAPAAAPALQAGQERIIIASRQGDTGFTDNPPLNQGAFGTVPQTVVGTFPTPVRNNLVLAAQLAAANLAVSNAALPRGDYPNGIEHLIVQAILGQFQTPPLPGTLVNDS